MNGLIPMHHSQVYSSDAQKAAANDARVWDEARINQPILYASGPYEGQWIRGELRGMLNTFAMTDVGADLEIECQKANLGRKFAKRDRRPLDPPPVVHLRLFRVENPGTPHQTEVEIPPSDIETEGTICYIDLFRIHEHPYPKTHPFLPPSAPLPGPSRSHPVPPIAIPHPCHLAPYKTLEDTLFGTLYTTAACLSTPAGQPAVFFAFADLSVKHEGLYIPRYRTFNLFSMAAHGSATDAPILAECYGGPFSIYSTKEFPGLEASTELTKHLARFGIRVNLRETERKRRPNARERRARERQRAVASASTSPSSMRSTIRRDDGNDDDDYDGSDDSDDSSGNTP